MKIAYISTGDPPEAITGGVGKKMIQLANIWCELGHHGYPLAICRGSAIVPGIGVIPRPGSTLSPMLRAITMPFGAEISVRELSQKLKAYQPDIIFLRLGSVWVPALQNLFRMAPVIIEINTNDLGEGKLRGPVVYWMKQITRRMLLNQASGYIPVSHELASDLKSGHYHKPSLVISNGIDLRKITPIPAPCNHRPKLILVGSPNIPWHGVDKLVRLANLKPDIQIEIIGLTEKEAGVYPIPSNVSFKGFVPVQELPVHLAEADAACGTLALHRKGMNEASTLKVREALAYGIPLVLAYDDTDLMEINSETILRIPNIEPNVELYADQIHNFCYAMLGKRVLRDMIAPCIDQVNKERQRIAFFEGFLSK